MSMLNSAGFNVNLGIFRICMFAEVFSFIISVYIEFFYTCNHLEAKNIETFLNFLAVEISWNLRKNRS